MPKSRPLPVNSMEERLADAWLEEAEKVADRIAADEGTPPSSGRVGDRRAVMDWGLKDPKVDHDRFVETLMRTGMPQEAAQTLYLAETYPDLLSFYLEPVQDHALADQLATLAEYPWRVPLVLDHSDDDEERCRRAEHLDHLWQQERAAIQEQMSQTLVMPSVDRGQGASYTRPPDAEMLGLPARAPEMGA